MPPGRKPKRHVPEGVVDPILTLRRMMKEATGPTGGPVKDFMQRVYDVDSWQEDGDCYGTFELAFFYSRESPNPEHLALAYCDWCPVKMECLVFALVTNQQMGVWGGVSATQRRKLRRNYF